MKTLNEDIHVVSPIEENILAYTSTTIAKRYISNLPGDRIVATICNGIKIPLEYVPTYGDLPGVYIVSTIDIPYDKRFTHDNLINPTIAYVKNIDVRNLLIYKFSKQYPTRELVSYHRFISEEMLAEHGSILINEERLFISYNSPDEPYPEEIIDVSSTETTIEYRIYSQRKKTYYLKVANSIKPIRSQSSTHREGLYIFFTINDIKKKIYYPLDEIAKGGVYHNRHDAMSHGNFVEMLEVFKLQQEIMLLETQVSTKVELMRLSLIKSEAEADIKISLAKQQQDIANRKTALENKTLDKKNLGFGFDVFSNLLTIGGKLI